MLRQYLFFALLAGACTLPAQEAWDLQRCIQYGLENNIQVQKAYLNVNTNQLTLAQNRYNRLPSVSGGADAGLQFGRTIDPTTNTFDNTRIGFNRYSVNGNVLIYGGNQNNLLIEQSRINTEAAKLDAASVSQTTAINIATAFLNAVLAEEQLSNTRTQTEQARQQLERTEKLISAGQLPANARLELASQLASSERLQTDAQNTLDQAYLSLQQLLQLSPDQGFKIASPVINVDEAVLSRTFSVEEVYRAALLNQPDVKAAELRVASAQKAEQVSRAGRLPSLSAFGSLSTTYSSVAPDFNNPNTDNATQVARAPIPVNINGQDINVVFYDVEGVTFPTVPYFDQLNENFGQALGLSLSVPIYSNSRNSISEQRAKLNTLDAELNARNAQNLLLVDVQNAVAGFRASQLAYQAADRAMQAAEAAYQDAQRRFDLGAMDSFAFNTAQNNLNVARIQRSTARYQLIFNLKIVELYMGLPLQL